MSSFLSSLPPQPRAPPIPGLCGSCCPWCAHQCSRQTATCSPWYGPASWGLVIPTPKWAQVLLWASAEGGWDWHMQKWILRSFHTGSVQQLEQQGDLCCKQEQSFFACSEKKYKSFYHLHGYLRTYSFWTGKLLLGTVLLRGRYCQREVFMGLTSATVFVSQAPKGSGCFERKSKAKDTKS